MPKLNTYLNFDGTCEEAFNFYKSIFGGEFSHVQKMDNIPGMEIPDTEKDRIMHISLPIGKDVLMGSDILPSLGYKLALGNNNYICVNPESREEADRLFNALSEKGNVEMPMADQFWGDYFGSFSDQYGVQWMICYTHSN